MDDIWADRRVKIGYETAEELAKHAHELNWRGHPEGQANATNEALDSLGWIDEIKVNVNTGNVFNGHLRISLALAKDPTMPLPVDYYDLTPDEELLALQVLDATTEMAEPIADKLAALMERTRGMTADRPGLAAMLEGLKARAGMNGHQPGRDVEPQIDKADELRQKWGVSLGQVWQLGEHRLACGDCTDRAVVEAVMGGARAVITFTSPPYNVGSLNILGNVGTLPKYKNDTDKKSHTEYLELLLGFTDLALSICDEVFMNIGLVEGNKRAIISYLMHYIEVFKDFIYWKKYTVAPHIQKGVINNLVEFVICLGDGNRKFKNAQFGQGTYWNVIEGPNASGNEYAQIHKATFPLYFPAEIINNFSPSGVIVYDPFLGSGTTLIACENLNRRCRAIELDPGYCAVAIQRWADLTGQQPQRVSG